MTKSEEIINQLKSQGNSESLKGMARYGINTENALGVSIPFLRKTGKKLRNDHILALELWDTKIHEARILAGIIDNPKEVTEVQIEKWVKDFNSWDLCDQCCSNLFANTDFAYSKALEWADRKEEYVKRAGFVMMACLAHKKHDIADKKYEPFFKLIQREATDERHMVKKAVNWALRQIGKRNPVLNEKAIAISESLLQSDNKTTLWIARDAYKELTSNAVKRRIKDLF
jgi:3-methyladenine DNA glycosylase AlkD